MKKRFRLITAALVLTTMLLANCGISLADTPSSWAQSEIDTARSKGLVVTDADKNYQGNVSRVLFCSQVVNMVETVLGYEVSITISNPFTDTSDEEIMKAYQLGIVNGISATKFAPNDPITREQIAAMMMRGARKLDNLTGETYAYVPDISGISFSDQGEISSWALEDIKKANSLDIMKGVGEGRINPKGQTTVEQSILLIGRLYDGFIGAQTGTATPDPGSTTDPTVPAVTTSGGENNPPEAKADPLTTPAIAEMLSYTYAASGFAEDPDGDALRISAVNGQTGTVVTTYGTAVLNSNGTMTYTAKNIDSDQTETLSVSISDGTDETEMTVSIPIVPIPATAPKAISNPVTFSVTEQEALTITASELATDTDGDTLAVTSVSGANYGTATVGTIGKTAGKIYYQSNDITTAVKENLKAVVTDGTNSITVFISINVEPSGLVVIIRPYIVSVAVTGEAKVGQTLSVGTILYSGIPADNPSLTYSWMRAKHSTGEVLDNIPGATGTSYVITSEDLGKYLLVEVTAQGSVVGNKLSTVKGPVTE